MKKAIRRPLDSDQLGAKGESRFRELCADSHLVCNPSSERDRTGWDFYVEFPSKTPSAEELLDNRAPPISCYIQVKTMWAQNDRFRVRLSSAERLAKERKPTFIYVLKVDDKLGFVNSYLIEIIDDNLSLILLALRKAQAEGSTRINRKTLALCASKVGCALPPTGYALQRALTDRIYPTADEYTERKIKQIQSAGFEADRHTVEVGLEVAGLEHFVDVFLGLKEAKITEYRASETRFGIKVPLPSKLHDNTFRVTPIPIKQCRVVFKADKFEIGATFSVDFITPAIPNLTVQQRKSILKCQFFELTIQPPSVHFTTKDIADIGEQALSIWMNYFKMRCVLASGRGIVTIHLDEKHVLNFDLNTESHDSTPHKHLLRVVEALERLLQVAGCPDETIDLDRLTKYSAKILATADLLDSSIKPSALHVKTTERDCLASKKVLFINYLRIGKKRLVFSAFAIMAPKAIDTGTLWESESIELKELRSLPDFPGVYQEFVEKARVEIEVPCTIILDPSDEDKLVDEGFEQDAQNAAVVSPTSS